MSYQEFEEQGFLVIQNVLSPDICADLLQYIISSFSEREQDYIIEADSRIHSPLALNLLTENAVKTVVTPLYQTLDVFLSGSQRLVELSSITVFPHAKAQRIHPDELNVGKNLISVFVNLAPTSQVAGALNIFPGSHKDPDFNYKAATPKVLELPVGSAVYMNSKTWHGGGANQSPDKFRPVFYFSFGEPHLEGPTYSIRSDVFQLGRSLKDFKAQSAQGQIWSKDSRPTLVPGTSIVSSLGSTQDQSLFLVSQQRVVKRVNLSPNTPWIRQIISLVVERPGEFSLEEIQSQVGIDLEWLIQFFSYYAQEGWFGF